MGRPSKGGTALRHAVTVKMSDEEKAYLISRHGTPYRGLRALIEAEITKAGLHITTAMAAQAPKEQGPRAAQAQATLKPHRHRAGTDIVAERFEGGTKQVQYRCTECEAVLPFRKA